MAYKIIKRSEEKKLSKRLLQLKEGLLKEMLRRVTERDVKKGQKHKSI